MPLKFPPHYESWFAEKSTSLIEHLARAMAAHRHIEDDALRNFIGGTLEAALNQAMKITVAGLYSHSESPPVLEASITENPDAAVRWLKEVRVFDKNEKGRTRPSEGIVQYVERVLEESRNAKS